MKWKRELRIALTLGLGSTLFAVVLAEIILRLFFPIPYSMEIEYVPDGHLEFRLVPERRYTLASGGICTINNLGYRRATDLTYDKPDGVVRVVALGGSAAFSAEVGDDETWVGVLERHLRERYGDHVEVINAGVPGYSVFQSKINYVYRIRSLDPDIVVVYHTWNDMKFYTALEGGRHPTRQPYGGSSRIKSLLRHSQIAWRIRALYHEKIVPRQRENSIADGTGEATEPRAGGPAHEWERKNYDDLAMLMSADEVSGVFASQAGLLSADNVDDPEVRAVVYTEYVHMTFEAVQRQWEATARIIESVAREHEIEFVDLYGQVPHLRENFVDHVHLTASGNRRVGELLFSARVAAPALDGILRGEGSDDESIAAEVRGR
jgi:lysophospholipase L1-like esterase